MLDAFNNHVQGRPPPLLSQTSVSTASATAEENPGFEIKSQGDRAENNQGSESMKNRSERWQWATPVSKLKLTQGGIEVLSFSEVGNRSSGAADDTQNRSVQTLNRSFHRHN